MIAKIYLHNVIIIIKKINENNLQPMITPSIISPKFIKLCEFLQQTINQKTVCKKFIGIRKNTCDRLLIRSIGRTYQIDKDLENTYVVFSCDKITLLER